MVYNDSIQQKNYTYPEGIVACRYKQTNYRGYCMKKVYIRSNGCIDNLLDGKSYKQYFADNNWEIVKDPAEADLILANTCAFDKQHEDTSVADIEELKKFKCNNMTKITHYIKIFNKQYFLRNR